MSSRTNKQKDAEIIPGPLNLEQSLDFIRDWLEVRRVRNHGHGSREESEAVLAQIPRPHTALESSFDLLNMLQKDAEISFQAWRVALELEAIDAPASSGSKPRNRAMELLAFHEMLLVVRASGDKELINQWLSERSWAERLLIPLLLKCKATHSIVTSG